MRVLIYGRHGHVVVDGVEFITHANSVEPLVVHAPSPLHRAEGIDLCVQAGRGQVVVQDGEFLTVFQDGHVLLDDGGRVVYGPSPAGVG